MDFRRFSKMFEVQNETMDDSMTTMKIELIQNHDGFQLDIQPSPGGPPSVSQNFIIKLILSLLHKIRPMIEPR